MAKTSWRLGFGALVAWGAWCWSAAADQPYVGAPSASAGTVGNALITHIQPSDVNPTVLTIVDPLTRAIGVYHINRETGEIHLKGVRNISADLQMDQYNSHSPLPKEIREGLGRLQ